MDSRIAEIDDDLVRLTSERDGLMAARDAYADSAGIAVDRDAASAEPGSPAVDGESGTASHGRPPVSDDAQRTLADNIEALLEDVGKPLHASEIVQRLGERGIEVGGRRPTANVAAHLTRDKTRFRNVGRNTWALAAWPDVNAHPSDADVTDDGGR
jgi:hypothetical protein